MMYRISGKYWLVAFAFIFGIVTIGIAFLAQYFGPLMSQVANSIFGMVGGPLLGLFVGAMFFPFVNSWGAMAGITTSLVVTSWVAIGAMLKSNSQQTTVECGGLGKNSVTMATMTSLTTEMEVTTAEIIGNGDSVLDHVYRISYMWYSVMALVVAVVVGIVVSCATGGTAKKPVDPRLLSPFCLWVIRRSRVKAADTCGDNTHMIRNDDFDIKKLLNKNDDITHL